VSAAAAPASNKAVKRLPARRFAALNSIASVSFLPSDARFDGPATGSP
jgi:hypothetical protein